MKTKKIFLTIMLITGIMSVFPQSTPLSSAELYTLDGTKINTNEIFKGDQPFVLIFWKTNVKECCDHLNTINELYTQSLKDKGVKVIAVCVDCKGDIQHVKPFVFGHHYEFEIYIDKNGDFKRSMNVSTIPYTVLVDNDLNLYCRWAGYCNGIEDHLIEKIENYLAITEEP